jgi:hypothetical protein
MREYGKSYTQDPSLRRHTWGKVEPLYDDPPRFPVWPWIVAGIVLAIIWRFV